MESCNQPASNDADDWLGETKKAAALEAAVAGVIKEGKVRTYDMGGTNTTLEMAKAIADRI